MFLFRCYSTPEYCIWDPEYVLEQIKNRDTRIGPCADTGHWASSRVNSLDAVKRAEGRIVNLHLKDRAVIGTGSTDLIFGTGVSDISGIVTELGRKKCAGCIFVEYETNWLNSVPDVKQCLDFVRDAASKPKSIPLAN